MDPVPPSLTLSPHPFPQVPTGLVGMATLVGEGRKAPVTANCNQAHPDLIRPELAQGDQALGREKGQQDND